MKSNERREYVRSRAAASYLDSSFISHPGLSFRFPKDVQRTNRHRSFSQWAVLVYCFMLLLRLIFDNLPPPPIKTPLCFPFLLLLLLLFDIALSFHNCRQILISDLTGNSAIKSFDVESKLTLQREWNNQIGNKTGRSNRIEVWNYFFFFF